MTMWSPSSIISSMVSACSVILFLVFIPSLRVDAIIVGGVVCRTERSLPRFRWNLVVVCSVASRFSYNHWASKGCGFGN